MQGLIAALRKAEFAASPHWPPRDNKRYGNATRRVLTPEHKVEEVRLAQTDNGNIAATAR